MPTKFPRKRSIFKISSVLVNEIVIKVEEATENGDSEVLVTIHKEHIEKVCKETFLDGNGETPTTPEGVMVVKIQMMETLSTNTEI